jgi:hypothetical protein
MAAESDEKTSVVEDMASAELTEAVDIALSDGELALLRQLAADRGLSVNDYVRLRIREEFEVDEATRAKEPAGGSAD